MQNVPDDWNARHWYVSYKTSNPTKRLLTCEDSLVLAGLDTILSLRPSNYLSVFASSSSVCDQPY